MGGEDNLGWTMPAPAVAVLGSLAVPGAGHLVCGHPVRAAGWAAAVWGSVLGAMALSAGSLLSLGPVMGTSTLRIRAVLPEAFALGPVYFATSWWSAPHLWIPQGHPHQGAALMLGSIGGILALMCAADAHALASGAPAGRCLRAVLGSWVLPGLGHALLGRTRRAWWFGGWIGALFICGLLLTGGAGVDRVRHPYAFLAQILNGGPALAAQALGGPLHPASITFRYDAGVLFCSVAGLMTVLAMLDAGRIARQS